MNADYCLLIAHYYLMLKLFCSPSSHYVLCTLSHVISFLTSEILRHTFDIFFGALFYITTS